MTKEELIASGKAPAEFTAEEKALFSTEEYETLLAEFEARDIEEEGGEEQPENFEEEGGEEEAPDADFEAIDEYKVAKDENGEVICDEDGDPMVEDPKTGKPVVDPKKKKAETDNACAGGGSSDKKPKTKSALELEEELADLKSQYEALENEVIELREFKSNSELTQKQALVDSFYMLSDEDKKDVIDNIATYTLEEIEAKLAVIFVRTKASFVEDEESEDAGATPPMSFNLDGADDEGNDAPAFVQALRRTKKND